MTNDETEVTAIGSDLLITINGHSTYLAMDIDRLCDWTTTVMCKANCDDVLKIAWALESISDDIRKWYDGWKIKDFSVIE